MLPALFAFSTRSRVVASGLTFVSSVSSSLSSESGSSGSSPSLASVERIRFILNEISETYGQWIGGKLHKRLSLIIINKSGLLKTDHERFILLKTYYVFNSLHLILSCSSLFDYKNTPYLSCL